MSFHTELASKDCRVCNRRRVKCGREVPTCVKCAKRNLVCSGYGVILKWDQGVASRGTLKGKSLPVQETQTTRPELIAIEGAKSPETEVRQSGQDQLGITMFPNLERSTVSRSLVPFQLSSSEERCLLHHYDHIVAPNMAWADCQDNPWRSIVIPLALESPPLLNAIFAFAAKHINAVSFAASTDNLSMVSVSKHHTFQQQAVTLLAREIQELATAKSSSNSVSRDRFNALLATMLVLCNVETVWPDSSVWQVHLNAAQTVMASYQQSQSTTLLEDPTSTFLEQELFIANTFASITNFLNFTPSKEYQLDPATYKPSSTFIEFLKLLQMVTSLERQASVNPAAFASSGVSPSGLRKLFENARSRSLELGRKFHVADADDYLHLSRTVNCFYHAGLIYSYRALLKDAFIDENSLLEKETQVRLSKFELFRALGFTETSKPTFAQDLVWPLFIAGTEATLQREQEMVVAKLQQAMSETGFSNCEHALEFLRALWQRRAGGDMAQRQFDWIVFAREWTGQGRTFLVF